MMRDIEFNKPPEFVNGYHKETEDASGKKQKLAKQQTC